MGGLTERLFKFHNISHIFSEVFVEGEHGAVSGGLGALDRKV